MAMFGFDFTKLDKAELKKLVTAANKALEPAITSPANFDAMALNTLESMIHKVIDDWSFQGPLIVGAPLPTAMEVQSFLGQYPGTPQACADFCKANPLVVAKLQTTRRNGEQLFSESEKAAVLGNIDWLDLLLKMAPVIFKILLAFLI